MEPYQNPVPRKHCWTRHSLWAEFPSLKFFMFLLSGTSGSQREQGECSDTGTETASVRCLCSLDIRIGIHFSCVAEGGVCSSESEWRNLWFRCDLREQGTGNQFLSLHGKQKGAENTWFLLQNVRCCLPWWIHETLLLEHVHDVHQRYKGSDTRLSQSFIISAISVNLSDNPEQLGKPGVTAIRTKVRPQDGCSGARFCPPVSLKEPTPALFSAEPPPQAMRQNRQHCQKPHFQFSLGFPVWPTMP